MRQLDGLTPLHMAAMQRGGAAVAKTLLDAGADATLADNDGCTALHQALRLADHALFQTLHAALASAPPATDRRGVYLAGRHATVAWTMQQVFRHGRCSKIASLLNSNRRRCCTQPCCVQQQGRYAGWPSRSLLFCSTRV